MREHTSTSKCVRGQGDDDDFHEAATNKFRLDLLVTHRSADQFTEQGANDHESACVQVDVLYDEEDLMPNINITVYDRDSDPIKLVSDANGVAYIAVNRAHALIFAKAGRKIYTTPGEIAKGDEYELISKLSTSVLKMGRHVLVYPQEREKQGYCTVLFPVDL